MLLWGVAIPILINCPHAVADSLVTLPGPDGTGLSAAVLGDIDHDGVSELLMSSAVTGGFGTISVFSGRTGITLSTRVGDEFGASLAAVGDTDHDGCEDFVSGQPQYGRGGAITWFSGCSRNVISVATGPTQAQWGRSVAGVGDVTGDGRPDTLVGGAGCAALFSGSTPTPVRTFCNGPNTFGHPVAGIGDLNSDQVPDLLVGNVTDGLIEAYSGANGESLRTFAAIPRTEELGTQTVASAGDVDADGIPDVLVGSAGDFAIRTGGLVRVLSGRTGEILREWRANAFNFYALGLTAPAGDANNDGHADILLIEKQRTLLGIQHNLEVRSGKTGALLESIILPEAEVTSLVAAGDVNGDQKLDWLVGQASLNSGTLIAGSIARPVPFAMSSGLTGAWHNAASPGQGLMLEILSDHRVFLHWFGYDANGNQHWFGGVGTWNSNRAEVEVFSYRNGRFPPFNDPAQIERTRWGTLTLTFSDCNTGQMTFAAEPSVGLGRGTTPLNRITIPDGISCGP